MQQTIKEVAVRKIEPAQIEIEIRGSRPHIGKSYVTELIRRTLAENGIEANVVSGDNDQHIFQNQHPDEFRSNFKDMAGRLKSAFTIIDNNARIQGKK
jgi:hypothetical protein